MTSASPLAHPPRTRDVDLHGVLKHDRSSRRAHGVQVPPRARERVQRRPRPRRMGRWAAVLPSRLSCRRDHVDGAEDGDRRAPERREVDAVQRARGEQHRGGASASSVAVARVPRPVVPRVASAPRALLATRRRQIRDERNAALAHRAFPPPPHHPALPPLPSPRLRTTRSARSSRTAGSSPSRTTASKRSRRSAARPTSSRRRASSSTSRAS